jgi:hypothetical protein
MSKRKGRLYRFTAAHRRRNSRLRFRHRLENDPRFLARIERARQSLRAGRGVRLEDVEE